MAEKVIEVKAFEIHQMCNDCDGELFPTGVAYMTYPAQYPHKCNKCGSTRTYDKTYPTIEYRKV